MKVANTNGCAATVVGDVLDAAGGAGHQHMPDVALVLMRAGRADRRPPIPAAHVGHAVRLSGGVVAAEDLAGGRVDGVAGAGEADRVGAVPDLLDLAEPAAQVGPGEPGRDLGLGRRRPHQLIGHGSGRHRVVDGQGCYG